MTNFERTTLYIGVTNNLHRRVLEHQQADTKGFTQQYHLRHLVYYEATNDISGAIHPEKQLKKWNRAWKEELISGFNPGWKDLSKEILE